MYLGLFYSKIGVNITFLYQRGVSKNPLFVGKDLKSGIFLYLGRLENDFLYVLKMPYYLVFGGLENAIFLVCGVSKMHFFRKCQCRCNFLYGVQI